MPCAVFNQVSKSFRGRAALENLSFELKAGGRYGLIGPNGAGKSTLLRLMAGTLRPDAGTVTVGGLPPWREPAKARANMGILPEGAPLLGDLTVAEHLALAARLRGLPEAEFKQEAERLAEALSLTAFYTRPAGLLSLGQRRRAALASALLGHPDFLILDEPTGGLDPEESARLLALLAGLPQSATLLVSSHILSEISALASEVLVLARGRLAAFGPWNRSAAGAAASEAELRQQYFTLLGAAS
ncbi:MAG: ABC transporter ATP-binding protein [Candidatus Adiutrix sp.]|jgi:ABC-2 type transport system ATP-binding protein|nr:ABC transporter ATP-binding protein [Candidatus Adiutrix sp.]